MSSDLYTTAVLACDPAARQVTVQMVSLAYSDGLPEQSNTAFHLANLCLAGDTSLERAVGEDEALDEEWLYAHADEFVESVDEGPTRPVHEAILAHWEVDEDDVSFENGTYVITVVDGDWLRDLKPGLAWGNPGIAVDGPPPAWPDGLEPGSEISGTVKYWNADQGYGFLTSDDLPWDVFVHFTAIRSEGYRSMKEGQQVRFVVGRGSNGSPSVADVRPLETPAAGG